MAPARTSRWPRRSIRSAPRRRRERDRNIITTPTQTSLRSPRKLDGEGSIRLLTDANGQIANRYDYDSYGQRQTVIESLPLQPYGWKGREWIPGPNIYYNRARFYDPVLGRFMSQDPLGYEGGDWNFYSFAWSNPKNWNDPSGLDAAASYAGIAAVDVSVAPAEKAVGCALSSLFFSLSLDIANYSNVQSNGNCGATGTPPSPPQPPPPPPPPPNPCDGPPPQPEECKLPFDPTFTNCDHYPQTTRAGQILHKLCESFGHDPNSNCARKCLKDILPPARRGNPPLQWFWPGHPHCWSECQWGPFGSPGR